MTPGAHSPPGARLAAVLRQLRQRTGLSLAQLADATTYSKSSWERYLNGKSLPPRSAINELCRLADEPAGHALALLDIARTQGTQGSGPAPVAEVRQRRAPGTDTQAAGSDTAVPGTHPPTADSVTDPPDGDNATRDTEPVAVPPHARGPSETAPSGVGEHPDAPATGHHRNVNIAAALLSACAVVLGALVVTHLPPAGHEEAAQAPVPSPAATGALCRHTTCQDKDPISMRCGAEPLTVAEHETASGAWVQIRYSPECGAGWARMWGAAVKDRVELRVGGRHGSRHSARVTTRHEAETYVHTLMSVAGPGTPVQACFSPATGGEKECFEARFTDGPGTASVPPGR
ncbi:helix-turn-helix domain-containing protein [Streptomyces sp. WSLK1-3]|uniref:helix-turn-helix domain-containing protein n=1 Tax=Streptomyces sp. WSLK1-3 TaxID=3375475 RepID=UPI003790E9A0